MNSQLKFAAAVGVQLLVIFGIIVYKTSILLTGTDIVLRVQPVDPRDFLRGDYVQLRYEINRIDLGKVEVVGDKKFNQGMPVYIELENNGSYFSAKKISHEKPLVPYFIKGVVASAYGSSLSVSYNIESYFMPEGKARDLENLLRGRSSGDIRIGVKVDKSGAALISKIFVGDKEVNASDFKEVAAQSQFIYQEQIERQKAEVEKQRQESLDRSEKQQRDRKRKYDLIGNALTLESYRRENGVYPALKEQSFPILELDSYSKKRVDRPMFDDPLQNQHYTWVDNTGNSDGYCIYARAESEQVWYVMHSMFSKEARIDGYYSGSEVDIRLSIPLTLKDCGVEKPLTSVEGFIFVDSNKSGIFDNNEVPFKDVILFPAKIESSSEVLVEKMSVRPNEKGFFKVSILEPGTYRIGFRSSISTPFYGEYGKGTQQEFVATNGKKITNYNIAVVFE